MSDLMNARTADKILRSLARAIWDTDHDDECPTKCVPSVQSIVSWTIESPSDAIREFDRLVQSLDCPEDLRSQIDLDVLLFLYDSTRHPELTSCWLREFLSDVHQIWCADTIRDKHPLAPLVRAWQARPRDIERLDVRPGAILPQNLFEWSGQGAPTILTYSPQDNELPIRTGLIARETDIPFLPGMETADSEVVPAPALALVEEAGFGRMTRGSGARMDKRLLVLSLMAMPLSDRLPGRRYMLRPSLRTIVHEWLMPPPAKVGTGKDCRSGWRYSRHARTLRRAMNGVTLAGVILPDGREWRPVMFRALPDFGNLDSRAGIEIELPELSDRGPMIDRNGLISDGTVSDMAFDGWLTLSTLWDRAKARNNGHRIYATRPQVLRDENGCLVRADGSQVTGAGRNPVRGRNGQLQWWPGDVPQRDWRHPEAIVTGTERHPMADKVPLLDRDDRRHLFYGHATDAQSARMRSYYSNKADARLRHLEERRRVTIEDG